MGVGVNPGVSVGIGVGVNTGGIDVGVGVRIERGAVRGESAVLEGIATIEAGTFLLSSLMQAEIRNRVINIRERCFDIVATVQKSVLFGPDRSPDPMITATLGKCHHSNWV